MIVATFHCEADLGSALARLSAAGIGTVETYTPAPLTGADTASPIPFVIMLAGLLGGAASFGLQVYSATVAYPLNIGGRPMLAWPSFIPTAFENAVLVAIVAGFAGFMIINRMPLLYDPVDEAESLREASGDRWCLSVDGDPAMLAEARVVLRGARIEDVPS
jgi:hypothetical protein